MRRQSSTHPPRMPVSASSAAITGCLCLLLATAADAQDTAICGARALALVNGRIHTMDPRDSVASSVLIRAGRFAALDPGADALDACTDVIDLQGRTVIPGLIDNHVHYIRIANRPGYDNRSLETTFTVADALDAIRAKAAAVPAAR